MNCSICSGTKLTSLGTVPFDRNNADIPIKDYTPMEYLRCNDCNFIWCPEMLTWTPNDLGNKVYNEDYVKYDPDYIEVRPKNYAKIFEGFPAISPVGIKHLDYGSGSGVMSRELQRKRWDSTCYDPYSSNIKPTTKFNFITAIEVFEHSLNIHDTVSDIKNLLNIPTGVICFSTQFADSNTTIDWWYIGARNGHISILSEASMKIIATKHNLFFSSISQGMHLLQSKRSNYRGLFQRKL